MIKKGRENEEKSAQKSTGVILFDMGGSKLDGRDSRVASRAGVVEGGRGEYFQRYFSLKIDPLNI